MYRFWAFLSSVEGLRTRDNRLWALLSSVEGLRTCRKVVGAFVCLSKAKDVILCWFVWTIILWKQ